MAEDLKKKGAQVRAQLWGDDPQSLQTAQMLEDFYAPMAELIGEQLFGKIWSRPGLPLKTRSMVTVATLMALGRVPQLRAHMRGALNLGITADELKELILHVSMYSGMPTAMEAVRTLRELTESKS